MNTFRKALAYALTVIATCATKAAEWVRPPAAPKGGGGPGNLPK